jgi:hypothetical protein
MEEIFKDQETKSEKFLKNAGSWLAENLPYTNRKVLL